MTREEAIKIIKEFINGTCLHLVDQEALETLIPELKESEDEKIRKNLIELLLDTPAQDIISHHLELNKVLAYLEKQKELLESGKGLYYYDGEKAIYCGDPVMEENRRIFAMCQQEKQKEKPSIFPPEFGEVRWNPISSVQQKPAEWNEDWQKENIQTRFAFYTYKDDPCTLYLSNVFVEETSRNKGFGTKILAAAEKIAETFGATYIRLKVKQNSPANAWYRKNGYGYVAFEDGYNWLEKNLEYVKPNKQEWNEDDERKYQCIRSILLSDIDKKVGLWKYSEILDWYEKRGIGRYTNSQSS